MLLFNRMLGSALLSTKTDFFCLFLELIRGVYFKIVLSKNSKNVFEGNAISFSTNKVCHEISSSLEFVIFQLIPESYDFMMTFT